MLVIYTAVFTPYVAAFLLNEKDYNESNAEGGDPIVVIDFMGKKVLPVLPLVFELNSHSSFSLPQWTSCSS